MVKTGHWCLFSELQIFCALYRSKDVLLLIKTPTYTYLILNYSTDSVPHFRTHMPTHLRPYDPAHWLWKYLGGKKQGANQCLLIRNPQSPIAWKIPHFLRATSSMLTLPQTPTTKVSISHSFSPRAMRKYPLSPQSLPHELAASCSKEKMRTYQKHTLHYSDML